MAGMTAPELVILAAMALAISVAVVWLTGVLPAPRGRKAPPTDTAATCALLFRDSTLVDSDASPGVLPLRGDTEADDWARLRQWLAPRFDVPADAPVQSPLHLEAEGADTATLTVAARDAMRRLTLTDPAARCPAARHDLLRRLAEAEGRAAALEDVPLPIWLCDGDGRVTWQNAMATALPEADRARLFAEVAETGQARVGLEDPERWYDITTHLSREGTLVLATDVTPLVHAEQAQRRFVQTLGKTFADLPTGHAVFDREHRLALFNPALIDLTGLDPVFLSGRPEILCFFDMLRDRQVMPEPKDYASWRGQIHDMITAARGGHYQEVWSLVTGRTYRVTGQPHPDGAVAFLFEDISDTISASRHQRAERDTLQAVLDRVDEAVAVLSAGSGLVFCNRRFATLARLCPDDRRAGQPAEGLIDACARRLPHATLWRTVAARLSEGPHPAALVEAVSLDHGGQLELQLAPLGQGQMMLSLRHAPATRGQAALSA